MAENKQTPADGETGKRRRVLFAGRIKNPRVINFLETVQALVLAGLIALFIRHFFVEPFRIPSESMVPTLLVGDHIFVNKFAYGVTVPFTRLRFLQRATPQRGDVVVFINDKDNGRDYIKRVIGIPGDTIDMRGREVLVNGRPFPLQPAGEYEYRDRNGADTRVDRFMEQIPERTHPAVYRYLSNRPPRPRDAAFLPFTLDEGNYFVMGDNRDNSWDSRYWGRVPMASIKGKAMVVWFSWNGRPEGLLHYIRWGRFGEVIR